MFKFNTCWMLSTVSFYVLPQISVPCSITSHSELWNSVLLWVSKQFIIWNMTEAATISIEPTCSHYECSQELSFIPRSKHVQCFSTPIQTQPTKRVHMFQYFSRYNFHLSNCGLEVEQNLSWKLASWNSTSYVKNVCAFW